MPRGVYDRQRPETGILSSQPETGAHVDTAEPPRMREARRERRERVDGDIDGMARMKLAIPKEVQARAEAEGKALCWILSKPNRLRQAHAEDWDVVEDVDPVAADGESDTTLILHAKYKDWQEDGRRRRTARIDAMEQAMMAPKSKSDPSGYYTPSGESNRITRETGA